MTQSVTIPLWLAILMGLLAAWAIVSRLLLPSVRWYLGRRLNRLTERLNSTLALKIPPIAVTRRQVLIDRLVYDPKVMHEAARYAEAEGIPRELALQQVERYAREIVPAFNAYLYFRVGSAIGKALLGMLYRVRLGHANEEAVRQ